MIDYVFQHAPYLGLNAVFDSAQNDVNSHPRLRKELLQIYEKNPKADFIMEFIQCLSCCFVVPEKHPCIDRALDFASAFLAQNSQDMENVLLAVFEFIFKNHSCKSQTVRLRCCEFIYMLLHSMDDQAALYDDIYEKITSSMLERLQDKKPNIRAQAVMALQRLQVPSDPNCPIIKAFLFHMVRDPSPDVRARVVKHIAATPRTLSGLFDQIHDVKSSVRKEAFKALSHLRVVKLSIKQRQKICSVGLADKSEPVKSFVLNNMMYTWYKQCDCDYITFLKILFVETMKDDTLEVLLFHLFKKQPTATLFETVSSLLNKEKVLPLSSLTPEKVTLWLYAVKYLSSIQDGADLDKESVSGLIPELTKFSKYLKDFSLTLKKGDLEKEFIAIQLFKIAETYSFDDEMGREQLRLMCINYLMDENVGKGAVPPIVRIFEQLVPSVKDRLVTMAEIISDIREPLMPSQSSGDGNVEDVQGQMALLNCDSLESERVLKTDPETLVKCLTLIIEVFKSKDINKIDATLLSLKDHFVRDCFNSPSSEVQSLAQDVMTFFCIWSLDIAKENFLKFCFQLGDDGTCRSALSGVVDILLVHGFAPFGLNNTNANKPTAATSSLDDLTSDPTLTPTQIFIVSLIVDLLKSEKPDIRTRAYQGLVKLIISGHLTSSLVLAKLILIWFSPSSAAVQEIRQYFGLFLNMFSTKSRLAGNMIVGCIIPALKAIMKIETDEDDEIDPLAVAKLLVSLLKVDVCLPPVNMKEVGSYHLQLATLICKELLVVDSIAPLTLTKILQMLEFQPQDSHCCSNLHLLVCRGIKKMGKFWDKKVLNSMQNLKVKLEDLKRAASVSNEEPSESFISQKDTNVTSDNAATSGDISKSYSGRIPVLSSNESSLKTNRDTTNSHMIIEETIVEEDEVSAIMTENAGKNVVDETVLSSDEDNGDNDGVVKGAVISDSDEEEAADDSNVSPQSCAKSKNKGDSDDRTKGAVIPDSDEEEAADDTHVSIQSCAKNPKHKNSSCDNGSKVSVIPDSDEETCDTDKEDQQSCESLEISGVNQIISSSSDDEVDVAPKRKKQTKKIEPPAVNTRARSLRTVASSAVLSSPRRTRSSRNRQKAKHSQ